jgi:hypothetical protein
MFSSTPPGHSFRISAVQPIFFRKSGFTGWLNAANSQYKTEPLPVLYVFKNWHLSAIV